MSQSTTQCIVCQGLIDEEDLFCANCGTEAPHAETTEKPASRTSTHNFDCSGCGASMSYDATAGSLRCPFCGSVDLVQKQDGKTLSPSGVVSFTQDKQQAVGIMRRWLGKGFWRPGDLSERAMIVDMTAVYVPYWVFRARTHTYWTADTSRTPAGARGDWFPLSGEHHGNHRGLLVGASGALSPAETSAICPFDLENAVKPETVDLDGVTVEQFSVGRKYARPLARGGLERLEARDCTAQYVPARCRNMQVNTRIEGLSSEPLLLPVWIMAYRYKDQLFRFLVNGQSGRATGAAPTSWRKIAAVVGIVLAAVVLVVLMVGMASAST